MKSSKGQQSEELRETFELNLARARAAPILRKTLDSIRGVELTDEEISLLKQKDDLVAILNPRRPEAQRLEAARRVTERLENVIYRERWGWVLKEMQDRAARHHSSPEKEFKGLIESCLFEVIQTIKPLWRISDCYAVLRRKLNDFATEDALGPVWRMKTGSQTLQEVSSEEVVLKSEYGSEHGIAEIEARLTAELLIGKAKLSKLERQVYLSHDAAENTFDEIAKDLKKAPSTIKTSYYRARKKITESL